MRRPIGRAARALGLALGLAAAGPVPPALAACTVLPPAVPDRVGRAQLFLGKIDDKAKIAGLIDVIWTDYFYRPEWAPIPGVYSMKYMTATRDPNPYRHAGPDAPPGKQSRDVAWYQRNHPDWVVYKCPGAPVAPLCKAGAPAGSPGAPAYDCYYANSVELVPLDTSNPRVREFLFDANLGSPPAAQTFRAYPARGAPAKTRPSILGSGLYAAVGVDNLGARNGFGRCGIYRDGAFVRQFTGEPVDPAFLREQIAWLAWLRKRVNDAGRCLAGNDYLGDDIAGFNAIAAELDIVLDEHGSTRGNKPMQTGAAWRARVAALQKIVAAGKPLILVDYLPNGDDLTLATTYAAGATWSLANYLLVKGDRTYLALTTEEGAGPAGIRSLIPPAFTHVGRPLGPMETDASGLFWRRFERALAIVNPSTRAARLDPGPGRWRGYDGALHEGAVELAPATAMTLVRE